MTVQIHKICGTAFSVAKTPYHREFYFYDKLLDQVYERENGSINDKPYITLEARALLTDMIRDTASRLLRHAQCLMLSTEQLQEHPGRGIRCIHLRNSLRTLFFGELAQQAARHGREALERHRLRSDPISTFPLWIVRRWTSGAGLDVLTYITTAIYLVAITEYVLKEIFTSTYDLFRGMDIKSSIIPALIKCDEELAESIPFFGLSTNLNPAVATPPSESEEESLEPLEDLSELCEEESEKLSEAEQRYLGMDQRFGRLLLNLSEEQFEGMVRFIGLPQGTSTKELVDHLEQNGFKTLDGQDFELVRDINGDDSHDKEYDNDTQHLIQCWYNDMYKHDGYHDVWYMTPVQAFKTLNVRMKDLDEYRNNNEYKDPTIVDIKNNKLIKQIF
ncbi:hypothetical protein SAMD00019534_120870 [Acytostelium subglobosum LB1]|uniref:hypothetical protein n=1 Tax=Acytostelium subglobosum LB1 TaxID=1410327 RepID=UPI000644BE97|nr:hypothetical protein SAMD00019534_120870 [Acytostelium subglobosum LB1]GAM28911.1 hypothetical protein SAMD00019534_120870 [Acytostelium subglobosum LB1]|eukprot:XP_012748096.1 hypothetical protein SAMD00019534_120870 [Acytostelium subglobosum LB1]